MNHGNLEKGAWWAPELVWAFWKEEIRTFKKGQGGMRRVGVTTAAVKTQ
jgi:hypothetical protein